MHDDTDKQGHELGLLPILELLPPPPPRLNPDAAPEPTPKRAPGYPHLCG